MPTRPKSCNREPSCQQTSLIRRFGLVATVAGAALAAQALSANAQHFSTEDLEGQLRCEMWNPAPLLPGDRAGTHRRLFVVQFPSYWWSGVREPVKIRGQYFNEDGAFE